MPDEDQLYLSPAEPGRFARARNNFHDVQDDLDAIRHQLAKLPTRKELALRPLYIIAGSAGLVIAWIELFRHVFL